MGEKTERWWSAKPRPVPAAREIPEEVVKVVVQAAAVDRGPPLA